ncbi:unnamed protein product [Calicophoron daubneyi]|uniref:Signal peptidase complex subunit 2 n=1 Tax=Calicophoron daubneyi TaxID=300641 RepID=A0AAV2TXQ0_CALDB
MAKIDTSVPALDVTVNKWNAGALKNALDDATKEVLSQKYKLVECHRLFDGRLLLCTISVLFACFGLLWDYLYPHPQSRMVLIACVLSYFLLSILITAYVMFVEKNIFFVGKRLDPTGLDPPDTWQLCSRMNKYDPTYHLSVVEYVGTSKIRKSGKLDRIASDFFDSKGHLRADLYIPVVLKLSSELQEEKKTK